MRYYIREPRTKEVIGFNTRKDALRFARHIITYEGQTVYVFMDASCKKVYANVTYMGYDIYNLYMGERTSFGNGAVMTVKADGTVKRGF